MSARYLRAFPALGLSLALTLGSCEKDDDTSHDEHHLEAFGVALVAGTDTLVRALGGQPEDVSGQLLLTVGQPVDLALHFLDEEGHWFRPEADPDGEHGFAVDHASSLQAQLDTLNWNLTLDGLTADSSTITVRVLHLGHDDYVSPALPVIVQP